jgi:rubrerythrin
MWGMKHFPLIATLLVAVASVCQAASEAAQSARSAAQQYGAAVRNCDMRWAVDSMYPPLRRTYADRLTSNTREAEIARARRVQGLDRETVVQARARMAANDKALRAKYARMGEEMKKSGLQVESYTDLGSHGMFLCKITESETISNEPSMTYAYYHANVKPKPQKPKKKGYVCKICGYVYEGDTLPEDFVCPLCKHGASDFEEIQ